jgi:signal transduction histidine kinase
MTRSVGRTVRIGLALVVPVLVINASVSWRSIRRIVEIERWISHTHGVRAAISETLSTLSVAEVEQRNYLITGDARTLVQYGEATASLQASLGRLESLTADNPLQSSLVNAARSHIDRRIALLEICARVRREKGFTAAVETVRAGSGRTEMKTVQAILSRLDAEEEELLQARSSSSRRVYSLAVLTSAVSAVVSLALIGLNYAIVGRTIAGRARAEALLEADRRKDEFLAMLAHELRGPLAAIQAALDSIRLVGREEPTAGKPIATIEHQAEHLSRLIEDLLDISRIARGKLRLQRVPMKLSDALELAIEISRSYLDRRTQQLTVEITPSPLPLIGDRDRLAQAFANLLINASKYSGRGSRIWLTVTREVGDLAVVRVRDEGRGIANEMMPRLFGLFTQEERIRDDDQGGLGVGLSLVKQLTEMHGGTVEAHSDGPGMGSEFVVRLPLDLENEGPPGEKGQAEEHLPMHPLPCRVLMADDNTEFTELYQTMLAMRGHVVEVIHNGTAVVEAARQFRPDVILLDIGLPGLDGFEIAERLRQQPETQGILLVALSGSTRDEDRTHALDAGFNSYMTKPVRFAEIEDVLSSRV